MIQKIDYKLINNKYIIDNIYIIFNLEEHWGNKTKRPLRLCLETSRTKESLLLQTFLFFFCIRTNLLLKALTTLIRFERHA